VVVAAAWLLEGLQREGRDEEHLNCGTVAEDSRAVQRGGLVKGLVLVHLVVAAAPHDY